MMLQALMLFCLSSICKPQIMFSLFHLQYRKGLLILLQLFQILLQAIQKNIQGTPDILLAFWLHFLQ